MRANPLAAINSVALAVGRFSSLDETLDYALRKVLEVVRVEAGGLYLLDEERGELGLTVHHGLSERAWRDFDHLRLGEGLSGRVALTGEPIVVRTLKDDPRLTRMAARLEGFCAFASVPLRSHFKTYGTLNVYTRDDRSFSEEEVQLLTSMASQIGLAVANTRLYLAAKASERKFRGLVENAEDVIYLTDLDGRIVYANPAMSRLLGYDPAVLCADGWPMLSLVHEDDRDRLATLWTDRAHDQPARSMELRVRHADGSRVLWFSQTAVTLRDEAGAPTGLQCIAQDITARRAWQQQMMQAERLADLGRMAATIAHEIRNPLGAIVNSINVLKRAGARSAREESVDEARLLDIVAEETDRLNAIVSEVLMFARPPARAVIPCDVLELVESTTELFARGGSLRDGVRLRVQCDASLPLVPADPNQMRQVLWNLLTNAADAAIAGAIDIVARAQDEGRTVAIEVTDDGPGVKDVTAVLEPFYTTRAQGTGLGLAIVARIVRDHGGSIAVANVPGRGARFTIGLPVSEWEATHADRAAG